jgi:hypothetical protein
MMTLSINTQTHIHRRGAKSAEEICFMFAVDPPKYRRTGRAANIKDDPLICKRSLIHKGVKSHAKILPERHGGFHFRPTQQKAKRIGGRHQQGRIGDGQ